MNKSATHQQLFAAGCHKFPLKNARKQMQRATIGVQSIVARWIEWVAMVRDAAVDCCIVGWKFWVFTALVAARGWRLISDRRLWMRYAIETHAHTQSARRSDHLALHPFYLSLSLHKRNARIHHAAINLPSDAWLLMIAGAKSARANDVRLFHFAKLLVAWRRCSF